MYINCKFQNLIAISYLVLKLKVNTLSIKENVNFSLFLKTISLDINVLKLHVYSFVNLGKNIFNFL